MVFERYIRDYTALFRDTDRNMWNYEDGCVLIGLLALYEVTADTQYFDVIRTFVDRYIDEKGAIRKYDPHEYNLDYIPSGRVLFSLYDATKKPCYRTAIEHLMQQLREQPRADCGSFWHKGIYPNQIWLDGLYMGLPYYLLYENRFGDSNDAYDDILRQFENARHFIFDEKKQLYYHAWNETKDIFWADKQTGLSQNFWTRAIGWHLMALADVYELLPEQYTRHRARIRDLWKEALQGVLLYQDVQSGLFFQLIALPEQPGNYLETSGSLMIAYAILKGVRLSVLEPSLRGIGEEILAAIETKMFRLHAGSLALTGICKGAGLGPDGNYRRDGSAAYYLDEEIVSDEQKGVGVCMMAYAEWLRLRRADLLDPIGYPTVSIFTQEYDPILPHEIATHKAAGA